MKQSSPTGRRGRGLILLGVAALIGCARTHSGPELVFEYRYRVFEAKEPLPALMVDPVSGPALVDRFLNAAALNRSLDLLSSEGFELWKVENLPGSTQYLITFRRPIREGYRLTLAPMEFTGVYQAQPPANPALYYALAPRYRGYTVFIFQPGEPAPRMVDADWDEATRALRAQQGATEHVFLLSADGMTLAHEQREMVGDRLERRSLLLRRLQSGR